MGLVEAVQTGIRKYADFGGRAGRSEFWWFFLFVIVAALIAGALDLALRTSPLFAAIWALGVFIP